MENIGHTALDIADIVIGECIDCGHPVGNLHLQKLLFLIQCEHIASTGDPLFGEDFEAWRYGPAIPTVYNAYSLWGGMPITRRRARPVPEPDLASVAGRIVLGTARAWASDEPWELNALVLGEGSPWRDVYRGGAGERKVIGKSLMGCWIRPGAGMDFPA